MTPEALYTAWALGMRLQERHVDSDYDWEDAMDWTEWRDTHGELARETFLGLGNRGFIHRIKPE